LVEIVSNDISRECFAWMDVLKLAKTLVILKGKRNMCVGERERERERKRDKEQKEKDERYL
jgi:hypothetical protein